MGAVTSRAPGGGAVAEAPWEKRGARPAGPCGTGIRRHPGRRRPVRGPLRGSKVFWCINASGTFMAPDFVTHQEGAGAEMCPSSVLDPPAPNEADQGQALPSISSWKDVEWSRHPAFSGRAQTRTWECRFRFSARGRVVRIRETRPEVHAARSDRGPTRSGRPWKITSGQRPSCSSPTSVPRAAGCDAQDHRRPSPVRPAKRRRGAACQRHLGVSVRAVEDVVLPPPRPRAPAPFPSESLWLAGPGWGSPAPGARKRKSRVGECAVP